ncbi:PLP-dependent aminotransferase family protein [Oxalobacteraceae bacterium OM1]|nr:PLP-dependent aminotransferase family protein [Oxalobacteraceae bacterium OM1]
MELHIVLDGRKDLTGQLYRQLRDAIRSGRLAGGAQLPPSRLLSDQLGVSRKTVAEAYAKLTIDKLLTSQVGIGTFVAKTPKAATLQPPRKALAGEAVLRHWSTIRTPLRHLGPEGGSRYEFIGGYATKAPFPHDEWRRCMTVALRAGTEDLGRYSGAEGLRALRESVARHAGFLRGVRCTSQDIVITNGAQQALDLVARVLVEPGATVAVEEPGYPPARLLFESQGAKVVGVPVDADGMMVEQIPSGTRLIYTTPSHQFPLGMSMSAARREALLARAAELGAVIIEDDYDCAFRYEGSALDSLQSMDRDGLVVYVGTFSKVLLPEVRVGYLVAPPALLEAVTTAKHLTDWHTPTLLQRAVARFIDSGALARHIRRCHATYASRRDKILRRLTTDLSPWFEPIPAVAGFHLSASLRSDLDVELLCRLARRLEVGLYPLGPFYHGPVTRPGLLFGFGAIDTIDIDEALDRVRHALTEMTA